MARVDISDVVVGASAGKVVQIHVHDTTTVPPLYAGPTGTTPGNLVTNKAGHYGAWVDEGRYDLVLPTSPAQNKTIDAIDQETVAAIVNAGAAPLQLAARAVAVSNISLSGTRDPSETDGVAVPAGDVVLCVAQNDPIENGLWIAGTWTRPEGFTGTLRNGYTVFVYDGVLHRGSIYGLIATAKPITVGTTALVWEENTIGSKAAADQVALVPFIPSTYQNLEDWPSNALPGRSDMFQWPANLLALHPRSAQIVAAIKEGAANKISTTKVTEYGPEDFNPVMNLGRTSDPSKDVGDIFTYWPKVHVPTGAPTAKASTDKGVLQIQPDGRGVTTGASTVSGHDLVHGPGISSNSAEGAAISMTGEALVADTVATASVTSTNGSAIVTVATADTLTVGMTLSANAAIPAGTKVKVVKSPTELELTEKATESKSEVATTFTGKHATKETGGPSSSRSEANALFTIRARNLYDADLNWRTAILHPLRTTVRGPAAKGGAPAGAGMAARAISLFGQGIHLTPADGRLPFVPPFTQGEATGNASSNVDAPPNGALLALDEAVFTDAYIASLAVPNWVRAVYFALMSKGSLVADVQGQEGVELCRFESLFSYKWRTDPNANYYLNWLKAHTDGKWLVEEKEPFPNEAYRRWKFDITGAGTMTTALFGALVVRVPPTMPEDLQPVWA